MPTKTINDLTNTPNILDGDELAFWNLANSRTDKISYLDLKADLLGTASDTEILFMDGTNIAGDPRITYNNATNVFSLQGSMVGATVDDFTNTVHADGVHKQIRNESGGGLVKGDLVHASGFSIGQDLVLVKKADASSTSTMPVMGVITETIANNASGGALESGRISGVDTSSFSVGDILFATTTPGVFGIRPTNSTDIVQSIGVVLRSHASLGEIEVEGAGSINTPPNLLDAAMWIGDATNFPVPRVISGDITISNSGVADISSGVVGDPEIGVHTSTKITITTKGQLNSNIVYTDQTNTFGNFDQIFPDNRLLIQNPAATFNYTIVAAAIAAGRTVTLPLLTGNDTFVTEAFASTLTNKTFDSTSNIWRTSGTSTLTALTTISRSTNNLDLDGLLIADTLITSSVGITMIPTTDPGVGLVVDSEDFILQSRYESGGVKNVDWKMFVDALTVAGNSNFKIQNQIDGGGYADRFTINSGGNITLNNATDTDLISTSTVQNDLIIRATGGGVAE